MKRNKEVEKIKKEVNTLRKKEALALLKIQASLINTMDDIVYHFKTNKWPLSYHIYLDCADVKATHFDQVLFIKKYKVVFKDGSLLIKK